MEIHFDINSIHQIIGPENFGALSRQYVNLDGFIFAGIHQANIFNAIVLRSPPGARAFSPIYGYGERSLEECIELINQFKLEQAIVFGTDISFLTKCPSLKHLSIYPSSESPAGFDYSPLYRLPQIEFLNCRTVYDLDEKRSTTIDYSKIHGLAEICAAGKGHQNYHAIPTLKKLQLSQTKEKDLSEYDLPELLKLDMLQCGIQSLSGIEKCPRLQLLSLSYMRSLADISALEAVSHSLRALYIENCPKISDFTVIEKLKNLEYLELCGKNEIPSLGFVRSLPKLKFIRVTMHVLDGDVAPCLGLQYADVVCKKHYNLKNKDLPKDGSNLGFQFI